MAKAYFIGGGPRVGKTSAMLKVLKEHPMSAISTDAIRASLREMITFKECPELFKGTRGEFDSLKNRHAMLRDHDWLIRCHNAESEIVWKAILGYIHACLRIGKDILVEGIAILPKNLQGVDFDYSVVFLVNNEEQTDVLLKHAHESDYDWLHQYDDDLIKAFASFNASFHQYYHDEALGHDMPILKVSTTQDYTSRLAKVAEILLKD